MLSVEAMAGTLIVMSGGYRLLAGLLVACWFAGGCQKPVFPEDQPRTPYERYQALRGQDRPAKTTDAFGNPQPDLRARLAPLNAQ
jgi:hypothetical protein